MGSRKGGISKESIRKLGTPIGAGPKVAIVRLGFRAVGEPSGLRSVGSRIFWRSPLAIALAPLPFLFCLPNRPLPPGPALPGFFWAFPEGPTAVVVEPVVLVVDPDPPEPPVGTLYSSVSSGPLQPGSARSTRPSPSSSARLEHCVGGVVVVPPVLTSPPDPGTVPVTSVVPTESELALPAATIARAPPSAMMTRSFFLIG